MITCPNCEARTCVKDGIVKGKQRYLCHGCTYRQTVQHRGKSPALKRQALELYLEGLGFCSIGRLLHCSHVAVYTWIKSFGESIATLRSTAGVTVIEMDELHTYIYRRKKNACWLWVAVDRHAKQFLHWVLGARDTATGQQLWDAVNTASLQAVMSDYWKP